MLGIPLLFSAWLLVIGYGLAKDGRRGVGGCLLCLGILGSLFFGYFFFLFGVMGASR